MFLSLAFCAVWTAAGTVLRSVLQPESIQNTLVREFTGSFFWTMPMGVAVYLAVVGAEHSVRQMMATSEREVQIARLSQQLSGAQLAALQAQLSPHFLFNTLNTLAVLVDEGDRTTSARIIEQLSDVLRRTLTPHQSSEVRLGAELQLVRQYLAIEQVRFADRLRTVFEINEDANIAEVPSFAIQHLVENAIRPGIARRLEATSVVVKALRRGEARGRRDR